MIVMCNDTVKLLLGKSANVALCLVRKLYQLVHQPCLNRLGITMFHGACQFFLLV